MRTAILAGMLIVMSLLAGCSARQGPVCAWTAQYTNCGYHTLESCRASLSAADAGTCGANPAYSGSIR